MSRSVSLRTSRALPRLLWLATWLAAGVSTRLAGRLAAVLWFVPWQRRDDRRTSPHGNRIVVDVAGYRLPGFTAGTGPTVLLIHGWADRAAGLAGFVEPLVARGHRVVAVDLPAHGDSPGHRTDGFVLSEVIRGLAARFEAQAIVAHSLGALATSLAVRDGLPLRGATFLAPTTGLDQAFERFVTRSRLPRRAATGLRAEMSQRYGPEVWDELAMERHGTTLALPALLVHDVGDRQVAIDDVRNVVQQWPAARLVETDGLGHRRLLDDATVITEVAGFVTDLTAADVSTLADAPPRPDATTHSA